MKTVKAALIVTTALFCLLLRVGALTAAQGGVQVRLSGGELFKTAPKNIITTTFAVTNTSDEQLEFMPSTALPEEWKLVTPSFPFRVGPGGTEIRLVGFFVPQTALVRKYEIIYRVNSIKYPSISDFAAIYVAVLPVTKLQARLLQAPESVIAGDEYEALFSVINASNIRNSVVIRVKSSRNQPFTVAPQEMTLAPGESKTVQVIVRTDEKLRDGFKHHLEMTVRSLEDGKMEDRASCAVAVIPRVTGEADRFHRIPAKIVLKSMVVKGETESVQFQGEFSGKGELSEDGKDEISFMFRGPDTLEDNSMFGQRDRYFAGYRNGHADFFLGDGYYSLSKLTEQVLEGRGARAGTALGDFGLRGYYMNTRWRSAAEKEGALHLDYRFSEKYRIGVNLLDKSSDLGNSRIGSIQGFLTPFKNTDIEFEAAYGSDDDASDNAYWLSLYGSLDWATYRLEYIRAEPDFPGYYQDKEYISGNFFFPVMERLSLNAALRQEKNNLDGDSNRHSASIFRFGLLGLNYVFDTGTSVGLESRYNTREDRFPVPDYDERELTLRARLGQSFRKAFFNLSAELGRTEDRIENQTAKVEIYETSGYVTPTPSQTYGAYVRFSNSDDPLHPGGDVLNAGLTGSFQLGQTTRFNARLETYQYPDSDTGDRNIIDVNIGHVFPSGWVASARGRHTLYDSRSDQEDETAFIVELTIPFGLPVARKKGIGWLEGRVRNQETGEPVSNAVLRLNGASAVTDGQGEFSFPALEPGTFQLRVDAGSIGLDRVPVRKTPVEVTIKGGEETSIDIGIARSASLAGQVMVYEFAKTGVLGNEPKESPAEKENDLMEAYGLANVLVEFSCEGDVLRVLTDRKGRFGFNGVRPGTWTLRVLAENLPRHHSFEKDRFQIELTYGDKKQTLIRVLPRKRMIRIIEEGKVLMEE